MVDDGNYQCFHEVHDERFGFFCHKHRYKRFASLCQMTMDDMKVKPKW